MPASTHETVKVVTSVPGSCGFAADTDISPGESDTARLPRIVKIHRIVGNLGQFLGDIHTVPIIKLNHIVAFASLMADDPAVLTVRPPNRRHPRHPNSITPETMSLR
jgi:hypothetical protein